MAVTMQAAGSSSRGRMKAQKQTRLPNTSTAQIRERWRELLELSYATRRVTFQCIEPGVYAVVVPPANRNGHDCEMLEWDLRAAMRQVPELARGARLSFDSVEEFGLPLESDFREWMGPYGADVASCATRVVVFVELAFLEAALLDRLWTAGILVDFNSPLTFFRRGGLMDYANVLEEVAAMVFEGRSLANAADRLANETLARLGLYADTFLKLSTLYKQCFWRITRDSFVMEMRMPGKRVSLALNYWELRGGAGVAQQTFLKWLERIERLLCEVAPYAQDTFHKSFAA